MYVNVLSGAGTKYVGPAVKTLSKASSMICSCMTYKLIPARTGAALSC